ncbi:hypothetical protein H4219_003260 [Mycoemilia scoparia]|uniref:Major facilitator superfamily (MFS) profile domain-containing protein n=1 Tax=Mycoemilia scoparia TaxID=417184 RepID=A0A9W8DPI2_9FUNG|nr:hypothetical protein H4219_003260 [Mycoemilia scoparia]
MEKRNTSTLNSNHHNSHSNSVTNFDTTLSCKTSSTKSIDHPEASNTIARPPEKTSLKATPKIYKALGILSPYAPPLPYDSTYSWIILASCFFMQLFGTGVANGFGSYQAYYLNTMFPTTPASTIQWIGTSHVLCINSISYFTGIAIDKLGPRFSGYIGTIIATVALMLTSLVTTDPWQLVLGQGVMLGIGLAFVAQASMVLPSQFFSKYRGLATGISSSGSCVGGMFIGKATQAMIDKVGIHWTLRITGFIVLVVSGISCLFIRRRIPKLKYLEQYQQENLCYEATATTATDILPKNISNNNNNNNSNENMNSLPEIPKHKQQKPLFNFNPLKNIQFNITILITFLVQSTMFCPILYLSASAEYYKIPPSNASTLLLIMNAAKTVGRIVSGIVVDKIGPTTTLAIANLITGISIFGLWYPATTYPLFVVFAVVFGLFGSTFAVTNPVIVANIFGVDDDLGANIGLLFLISGVGILVGNPIQAAIYDNLDGRGQYKYTILFSGAIYVLSFIPCLGLYWYYRRTGGGSSSSSSGRSSSRNGKNQGSEEPKL